MTFADAWVWHVDRHLSERAVQPNSRGTYRPQIIEYVEFACERGSDPSVRDDALLAVFLNQRMAKTGPLRPIAPKTRNNIGAAVRGWWDWCELHN